ncbi:hypothetical protein, partial [Klebsiella pneumoniae]|uniref:hypothetical protein n=1 Tax=Klebsiella pneumoniae TaxID=573 RepID=UPI0039C470CA
PFRRVYVHPVQDVRLLCLLLKSYKALTLPGTFRAVGVFNACLILAACKTTRINSTDQRTTALEVIKNHIFG